MVCSDAYTVTPESTVVLTAPQQPFIKLDDKHYKLVDKMEALVEGYPSLIDCTSLKVRPTPLPSLNLLDFSAGQIKQAERMPYSIRYYHV